MLAARQQALLIRKPVAQTLMLAKSSFHPFRQNRPRKAEHDWQHPVLGASGEALSLRPAGQAAAQAFMDQVLSLGTCGPVWL